MPTATVRVVLDAPHNQTVQVDYATQDGSALAGPDYVPASGTLRFPPGTLEQRIPLSVTRGTLDRYCYLLLSDPQFATLTRDRAKVTIARDSSIIDAENGPLIKNGLVANAFHSEFGRGGYFHPVSGTSEGQSIAIEAAFLAWLALDGGTQEDVRAADWFHATALAMLDAMGDGSLDGPMLRQPIPDDPTTICLLHWLFTCRGSVPEQGVHYRFQATATGDDKLIIPATVPGHQGGPDVFRVWMIYPTTSYLLYQSVYSPAYDLVAPADDTSIRLDDGFAGPLEQASPHWSRVGYAVEITIPPTAPYNVTEWNVVYAYQNAGTIAEGKAYEAYPFWTGVDDGYAACAPDTFRWFDYAIGLAILHDTRPGKATQWTNLRDAMRMSCVKGQNLSDLREVIKPMPQFDAIPARGDPTGMFCYSDHPNAEAPPASVIEAGGNATWYGYNFWSRVGGSGGDPTGSAGFRWSPGIMVYPAGWTGDIFNGALQWTVPIGDGAVHQVQIGRGFNDEWREATDWQDPDQFLFVALVTSKVPVAANEHLSVFVSSTKYFSEDTRWYADLKGHPDLAVGNSANGGPRYFLIPRTDFRTSGGAVLPASTYFENFGLSIEMPGPHSGKLVAMRLVSGASQAAVLANVASHVRGTKMPFFPGSLPFAINADTARQQYVGWNGQPFHGYQLPDYWYALSAEATAVHPLLDPAADLPIPNPDTGALTYPISATNAGGEPKPRHALLMEQQLRFLQAAQNRYETDGGTRGPFAHTFILNTPSRMSLGWPTPHTWVYTNDDPNTEWIGYQCRVVESLARLVNVTKADAAFEDARGLALSMVLDWLTGLDTLWPDLTGKTVVIDDEQVTVYGMPTQFPDPAVSAPQTLYEEPHGPALVLRACLWLLASGLLDGAQTTLVDGLGQRCWDYMEMRYRATAGDTMRFTWANSDGDETEVWYGFWHFEIIATLALLIRNPDHIPGTIAPSLLRQRLVETQAWLAQNVE